MSDAKPIVAIIGGGPAGLMAAERLSLAGHAVTIYDSMPTVARKFLLAAPWLNDPPARRFRARDGP